jgi:hypothetical protein
MVPRPLTTAAIALFLIATALPAAAMDETAAKERVGVRFGYVGTNDGLHDVFGDAWDATLFFTEAISTRFLLDIRLGAIYLGDMLQEDLDDAVTGRPGTLSQMRVLYFSAGPIASFSLGGANTGYASVGFGVYSVSMLFETGITAFDFSDQHLGLSGGLGVSRRIANSWSVELNGTVHYFGVDHASPDLYWTFTDGADDPLLIGVAAGVTLDLR